MLPYHGQEMTGYGMIKCPVKAFRLVASANLHFCSLKIQGLRRKPHHRQSSYHNPKNLLKQDDVDDPAGKGCLDKDIITAGFTHISNAY